MFGRQWELLGCSSGSSLAAANATSRHGIKVRSRLVASVSHRKRHFVSQWPGSLCSQDVDLGEELRLGSIGDFFRCRNRLAESAPLSAPLSAVLPPSALRASFASYVSKLCASILPTANSSGLQPGSSSRSLFCSFSPTLLGKKLRPFSTISAHRFRRPPRLCPCAPTLAGAITSSSPSIALFPLFVLVIHYILLTLVDSIYWYLLEFFLFHFSISAA